MEQYLSRTDSSSPGSEPDTPRPRSWRTIRLRMAIGLALIALGGATLVNAQSIVINEVFYQDPGSDDWIEYKNVGSQTIDISAYSQCSGFICVQVQVTQILAGDLVLDPGEIVVVDTAFFADEFAGEIALWTADFTMVDFVQYGSGEEFNFSVDAVNAGLWSEIASGFYDFVPTSAVDESMALCGETGALTLSGDYSNDTPTLGLENICQPIFADGFEAGNATSWSAIVP